MGDYFGHWLSMAERTDVAKLPKVFYVNWFRKDADGKFLWPGFGENSRVLEWVFERVNGRGSAVETPIGLLPTRDALPLDGLDLPGADLDELLRVDVEEWRAEIPSIEEHFARFGDRLGVFALDVRDGRGGGHGPPPRRARGPDLLLLLGRMPPEVPGRAGSHSTSRAARA